MVYRLTEMENVIKKSMSRGITPQVMVIINPGKPTGSILSFDTLANILKIANKYGIIIIAGEVYQYNIIKADVQFYSMKKVFRYLQKSTSSVGEYENLQLISLHSASKGVLGECGQRGGYMEVISLRKEVKQKLFKLFSISLCACTSGQVLVDLMVRRPQPGEESYESDLAER